MRWLSRQRLHGSLSRLMSLLHRPLDVRKCGTEPMSPSWGQLPTDILCPVLQQLAVGDFVRARQVSGQWTAAAKRVREVEMALTVNPYHLRISQAGFAFLTPPPQTHRHGLHVRVMNTLSLRMLESFITQLQYKVLTLVTKHKPRFCTNECTANVLYAPRRAQRQCHARSQSVSKLYAGNSPLPVPVPRRLHPSQQDYSCIIKPLCPSPLQHSAACAWKLLHWSPCYHSSLSPTSSIPTLNNRKLSF